MEWANKLVVTKNTEIMKKTVLLFCLIALIGCSSDDDQNSSQQSNRLLTDMIVTNDGNADTFHFEYDSNKNITAILKNGNLEFAYTYKGNIIESVRTDVSADDTTTFLYSDGKLTGYSREGEFHPIEYDAQNNKYIFTEDDYEVTMNDRDISSIMLFENLYFSMDYNSASKGPLFNVRTENVFLLTLFSDVYAFLSVRPSTGFVYNQSTFSCENTYDGDNYLTKMILRSDEEEQTIQYIYEEL